MEMSNHGMQWMKNAARFTHTDAGRSASSKEDSMMPIPNVIAGVLIGSVNDTWLLRILVPFGWGIAFCIYSSIAHRDKLDTFITQAEMKVQNAKFGMSHMISFHFIEYATATVTALVFSVVTGAIRAMF